MTSALLLLSAASAATPGPGDLVISEIMANPTTAAPAWIEITNTTAGDLDLSGVTVSGSSGSHTVSGSLTLPANGYALITPDSSSGLSADVLIEGAGISLGKTSGTVEVALAGVILDAVSYSGGAGFPAPFAASITLDPALLNVDDNDTGAWWCKAESIWFGSNKGTPGAENDNCPTPMLGVMAGDLVITELMIDPDATTDVRGEWLEILNTTDERIDIRGMVVTDSSGDAFTVSSKVRIEPGEHAVLAARDTSSQNGGIEDVAYGYSSAIELSNDVGGVSLSYGGIELESVTWSDDAWPLFPGVSMTLDARYAESDLNDSADFWCTAAIPYGSGDLGTPGEDGGACPLDLDGDGAGEDIDCDDGDADVHPWADEVCDGIDNDCDDRTDEGLTTTFYADSDGDGFGDAASDGEFCALPDGYADTDDDCDDGDASIFPGAGEVCDGRDNDCDDRTDEGVTVTFYGDADGDGYGDSSSAGQACSIPAGAADVDGDCDDADAGIHPGAEEVCDERDNDCDDRTDEGVKTSFYADFDGDGFGDAAESFAACAQPAGYAASDDDCDDRDASSHPGAEEVCDGADNDCDDRTDEDAVDGRAWFADADGDSHGDAASATESCEQPAGYVASDDDCDDADASTHPGAEEVCDARDNDCDASVDEGVTSLFYSDLDGDGFGDAASSEAACEAPAGYTASDDDCDDSASDVYPGADEVCDSRDNDCDAQVDEGVTSLFYADSDGDGFGDASRYAVSCEQPSGYAASGDDCDDTSAATYPGAEEVCDARDNDCDAAVDEGVTSMFYADVDGDGHGDAASPAESCDQPAGYAASDDDCDDADASTHPGAEEVCDARDNDCDGDVDESVTGTFYEDFDGDGFGDAAESFAACTQPAGYAASDDDCDDRDASSHPGAEEVCDGADNDCDDRTDEDAVDGRAWFVDADGDGHGDPSASEASCDQPAGYAASDDDCDDADASTYPGAEEVCDGIDNDCSGAPDDAGTCESTFTERFCSMDDGSTLVTSRGSAQPAVGVETDVAGWAAQIDGASWIWDEAEESTPERTQTHTFTRHIDLPEDIVVESAVLELAADNTWRARLNGQQIAEDFTGQTYRVASTWWMPMTGGENTLQVQVTNLGMEGATAESNPGGLLYCVTVSYTERPCQEVTWYADFDGDGFGDAADALTECIQPSGYVADASDCDDGDSSVHPWADEVCDGIDNDCSGMIDDADADGSGISDCDEVALVVSGGCGGGAAASIADNAESLLREIGLYMVTPGDLSGLSRYPAVVFHGDSCGAPDPVLVDALAEAAAAGSGLVVLGDSVAEGARALAEDGEYGLLDLLLLDGSGSGIVRGDVQPHDASHPVIDGAWGRVERLHYRAPIDEAVTIDAGEVVLMSAYGSPVVWAAEESGQRTAAVLMSIHGTPQRPIVEGGGQAELDTLFQNAVWWSLR